MTLLLLAVLVWCYAAVRDIRSRHVPNHVWVALAVLTAVRALTGAVSIVAVAVSGAVMLGLGLTLYRRYDFGGADAKALVAGGVLYPTQAWLFLLVSMVALLPFSHRDEFPMLPAFAAGAAVVTVV